MAGATITNIPLEEGQIVKCQGCGGHHPVRLGTLNGVKTNDIMAVRCNKKDMSYLVGIGGYRLKFNKEPQ